MKNLLLKILFSVVYCLNTSAFTPPYTVPDRFPYPYDHSVEPHGFNPTITTNSNILVLTSIDNKGYAIRYQQLKENQGFNVRIRTISEQENQPKIIKHIIDTDYYVKPYTYLTIIGDENTVKPGIGTRHNVFEKDSDPVYSKVNNDIYPDFVIGRIPFSNSRDLNNYFNKLEKYKTTKIKKSLGIGSDEGGNTYYTTSEDGEIETHNGLKDFVHAKNFLESMNTEYQLLKDPSLKVESIITEINKDIDFLIYIGHGTHEKLRTGNFSNQSVNEIENKKPFVFLSVACNVGEFSNKDSLSEELLKQNGNSKGAIIAIAGSTVQNWRAPLRVLDKLKLDLNNSSESIGLRFTNAMIKNLLKKDKRNLETFENWHILGDPALIDNF